MKLFVAYHYHDDDKWIRELIIPLIQALGIIVETGQDLHGELIVEEVPDKIRNSDAMISFITKSWTQHPWVRDELVTSRALGKLSLEIRDDKVNVPGGINEGWLRLDFDINRKDLLMLKLTQILTKWKRKHESRSLVLLPNEILNEARPHIRNAGVLKCVYKFKNGNEETPEYEAVLFKFPNSLGVDIKNIPSDNSLLQLTVTGPGFIWSCGYQPFNNVPINLTKE